MTTHINMNMNMNISSLNTPESQAQYLAQEVADKLQKIILDKDKAVLCVPGGSTPELFFRELSQKDIPWDKVYIVLNDERWVPPSDSLSNEAMIRDKLFINNAKSAHMISFYREQDNLETALEELSDDLKQVMPLDICVLGMGEDGHTASLFPNTEGLDEALDVSSKHLVHAFHVPGKEEMRVSLIMAALLTAQKHYLLIQGTQKKHIAELAIQKQNPELPISYIFEHADVEVVYTEA